MATIQRSLLIEAPIDQVYSFWCDFERFPRFMEGLARVVRTGRGTMEWQRPAEAHAGAVRVSIDEQIENRLIAWRYDSGPERTASLTFAPLEGNATWFTYTLEYEPDDPAVDVASRLTVVSHRLDRELRASREAIEATAAERPRQEQRR